MTDRDRLIELFKKIYYTPFPEMQIKANLGHQFTDYALERIVDEILANGVIVPPCKVGDKVYQTDGVRIYESTINEITFSAHHKTVYVTENIAFDETAIGKSIFLTKEEAEEKLKELNNNAR